MEIQASRSPKFSIRISILEVNGITYRTPTWSQLLDVVRRALQEGSTSATEAVRVVQALQGHLNKASYATVDGDSEALQTLNQFKALYSTVHNSKGFTQSAPPRVMSSVSFHCEAAMAALSQYGCKVNERPGNGAEDADLKRLRKICEVLNI